MIKTYTKEDFDALDFDVKCLVMEELLTNDYFSGQTEINFSFEIDEKTGNLLHVSPEVEEREKKAFSDLIEKLAEKLFENSKTIDLDIDSFI